MTRYNSLRQLWRCWNHQGGTQVLQWIGVVAIMAALGGTMVMVANTQGIQVAQAVTGNFTSALQLQRGNVPPVTAAQSSAAPSTAAPSTAASSTATMSSAASAAVAVPNVVLAQAGQTSWWSSIANWFNSLPVWVQGLLAAGTGALLAVVAIAAVAILVFGAPVWATIAVAAITVAIVAGVGAIIAHQSGLTQIDFWRFALGGAILSPFVMGLVAISWATAVGGLSAAGFAKATIWAKFMKTAAPFWPWLGVLADAWATGDFKWDKALWATVIGLATLPIAYVSSSSYGFLQLVGSVLNIGLNRGWNFIKHRVFGVPVP